jgi:hypothetical protein
MSPTNSIGKENAIELYHSNWWEGLSYREIAGVQLFTTELCCPFDVFHEAVEKSLGRLTKEFDDLIEFPHGRTTREYMDDNYAGMIY